MKRTVKRSPAAAAVNSKTKPKTKTLSEAQADFTAEGSPPPGLVATTPPDLPTEHKPGAAKTGKT